MSHFLKLPGPRTFHLVESLIKQRQILLICILTTIISRTSSQSRKRIIRLNWMLMFLRLSVSFTVENGYKWTIDFCFRVASSFPRCIPYVLHSFMVKDSCFDSPLTYAGISSKDQTVNGQDFKKDDRIFLDTESSNVDVCAFVSALVD